MLLCAVKVPAGNYVASCNFNQKGQDISRVALSVRDYNDYTIAFGDASSGEKSGYLEKAFTVPNGSSGFQIFLYSNQPEEALTTECLFEDIQVEVGKISNGIHNIKIWTGYFEKIPDHQIRIPEFQKLRQTIK